MSDLDNMEDFETFKANLEEDNSKEPSTEEATPTEPVTDNSVNTKESTPELDYASEYEKQKKSYEELQTVFGRQGAELGELRAFKKDFEPYLEYLKQVEQQQKEEQYADNPDLKYKDMMDQELAPYKEQMIEMEASKSVSTIQQELGEERYNELAPVMANVLRYYQENEPQTAEYLASNPVALVRQAAGDLYLYKQMQNGGQPQSNPNVSQAKQRQAQSMAGTAKSNSSSQKTNSDMGSMSLNEMREHLRKIGAAQTITE